MPSPPTSDTCPLPLRILLLSLTSSLDNLAVGFSLGAISPPRGRPPIQHPGQHRQPPPPVLILDPAVAVASTSTAAAWWTPPVTPTAFQRLNAVVAVCNAFGAVVAAWLGATAGTVAPAVAGGCSALIFAYLGGCEAVAYLRGQRSDLAELARKVGGWVGWLVGGGGGR